MDTTLVNPKKVNNIHLGNFKGDTVEISFDITDQNNKDRTVTGNIKLQDFYRTLYDNGWLKEESGGSRKVA